MIKIGYKYKAYRVNRDGTIWSSKDKAKTHYLKRYAPEGWQRHGPGYWLIGEIDAGFAWLDSEGNRHFEKE